MTHLHRERPRWPLPLLAFVAACAAVRIAAAQELTQVAQAATPSPTTDPIGADKDADPLPPPPVDPDDLKNRMQLQAGTVAEIVNEAKERDFNSKVRLQTFQDTVLRHVEPPGGARLVIVHRNEMVGAFTLMGIAYALDGEPCFAKLDESGALDAEGRITVFNAKVSPGDHLLAVQYDLTGSPLGLFGYMKDLKLTLRRTYRFKVESKRETRLTGQLTTNNSLTALYEQRPNIGFEALVTDVRASDRTDAARMEETAAALTGRSSLGTFSH